MFFKSIFTNRRKSVIIYQNTKNPEEGFTMAFLSDIEIAQACTPRHILKIAESACIAPEFIEQYGN